MDEKLSTITNLFEGKEIRSIWDPKKEDYYFNVVDVINSLAEPKDSSDYWTTLKKRLSNEEGCKIPTSCRKLKFKSKKDGKAIADIGGMMPEDMPTPKKSIKELEKERKLLENK